MSKILGAGQSIENYLQGVQDELVDKRQNRHLELLKKAAANLQAARDNIDSLTASDLFNLAITHMNAKTLLKQSHAQLALVIAEIEVIDLGSAVHYDKYQERD